MTDTCSSPVFTHATLYAIASKSSFLPWSLFDYLLHTYSTLLLCLQCFDAVGWVAGRASGLEKTEWWGAGVVLCLERGADLHMAQPMPLPLTASCFSKFQIGFTFLVPAHPGSPGKSDVKRVFVWWVECTCLSGCQLLNEMIFDMQTSR